MRHTVLLLLAACGGQDFAETSVCDVTSAEAPVASDAESSLGFSAADVVATLPTGFDVDVVPGSETPGAEATRHFTFALIDLGDATVQTQAIPSNMADQPAVACIEGDVLVFPATLTVSTDDGWVSGSGRVTAYAAAADPSQTWISGGFQITPSSDLAAEASDRAGYDASQPVEVWFYQTLYVWAPWATGPVGSLEYHEGNAGYAGYEWGLLDPP